MDTSLTEMHLFLRWRITEIIYSFPGWRKSQQPRFCIDISSPWEMRNCILNLPNTIQMDETHLVIFAMR